MVVVFEERKHPRDRLGRFRTKLSFRGANLDGAKAMSATQAQDEYFDWSQELTPEQEHAVQAYTGMFGDAAMLQDPDSFDFSQLGQPTVTSDEINVFMRTGEGGTPDVRREAGNLSDALGSGRAPEDMVVYRQFNDGELLGLAARGELLGAEVEDRGFMSTTVSRSASAATFGEDPGEGQTGQTGEPDLEGKTGIIAAIRVPKGARGAYIDPLSAFPGEQEFLLQDGTTAKVTGVDYGPGRNLRVTMDVVGQLGAGRDDKEAGAPGEFGPPSAGVMAPATAAEREALSLPPAWTNVMVDRTPGAELVATGYDEVGRKQYRYSPEHDALVAARKFDRIAALEDRIPDISERFTRDAETDDTALAGLLVLRTGLRPGSKKDTKAKKQAYGATTLQPRHVGIDGDTVRLRFTGKKGVEQDHSIDDPDLARLIAQRKEGKAPDDDLFDTTDNRLRDYVKAVEPGVTPKDFRTRLATTAAMRMAAEMPMPTNPQEYARQRRDIGKRVSSILGNEPKQALDTYIAPSVFAPWDEAMAGQKAVAA